MVITVFDHLNLGKLRFALTVIMVASLPFSESVKTISMYLLLAVFLLQVYRKEIKLDLTVIHFGLMALILSAFISSMFAENVAKSLKGLQDIIYYAIAFFIAGSISDEKQTRTVLWSLYLSTAAAALYGIVRAVQTQTMIDIHQLRNPNYIAMYLLIVLSSMVGTIILSDRETKRCRILLGIFSLILLIASVLTLFRGSFLGFFIFLFVMLFARKRLKNSLALAAGVVMSCFLAVFLYKPLWNKLLSHNTDSMVSRFYIWDDAINYFRNNPFFGIGLNHFRSLLPIGCPEAGAIYYDAHNIYLQTASQMGIFGLAALLVLGYGFLLEFFRAKPMSNFGLSLKYGALGGFLITFVTGMFDTTLHHGHAIVFTLLMGLFIGTMQKGRPSIGAPK